MSAKVRLKPCPFCGGPALLNSFIVDAVIGCTYCGCRFGRSFRTKETDHQILKELVSLWNRRAKRGRKG